MLTAVPQEAVCGDCRLAAVMAPSRLAGSSVFPVWGPGPLQRLPVQKIGPGLFECPSASRQSVDLTFTRESRFWVPTGRLLVWASVKANRTSRFWIKMTFKRQSEALTGQPCAASRRRRDGPAGSGGGEALTSWGDSWLRSPSFSHGNEMVSRRARRHSRAAQTGHARKGHPFRQAVRSQCSHPRCYGSRNSLILILRALYTNPCYCPSL